MAKPIAPTPIFEGEDLKDLIDDMNAPLTEKEKEYKEKVRNARDVPFNRVWSLNFLYIFIT